MNESRRERVFSFLSKDKEAIEVVAAAELFEAVTRARDTLLQAADAADAQRPTRGKILRYLATILIRMTLTPELFPLSSGGMLAACVSPFAGFSRRAGQLHLKKTGRRSWVMSSN